MRPALSSPVRIRTVPLSADLQNYGALLRVLRVHGKVNAVERQWTRAVLAEKIGISASHLARLERGAAEPGVLLAWRIADVFGLTLDAMLRMARDGTVGAVADAANAIFPPPPPIAPAAADAALAQWDEAHAP